MNTQKPFKQVINFVDLTPLPEEEQREKVNNLRNLVRLASREYSYPNSWRDYHFTFVNNRVVNPLTMLLEYMNQDKIKCSDLIFMGRDYDGYFVLASVGLQTIQEWKEGKL